MSKAIEFPAYVGFVDYFQESDEHQHCRSCAFRGTREDPGSPCDYCTGPELLPEADDPTKERDYR